MGFFFSQWLLMVCYHYSVTDLKPIFCVHSSIKPVNVISNAFINDENQLFKTVEPSKSRLTHNLSSVAAHILVLGWSHSVRICLNSMLMLMLLMVLTHWGRVMHKCVSELTIVGSDNGLSPGRCQAINWTIVRILSIGKLGTNFSEILFEIDTFLVKNAFEYVVWKMAAILSRLQCVNTIDSCL